MNVLWRFICWITGVLLITFTLAGCTSGGLSLTDGTIPIGDIDGKTYLVSRANEAADITVDLVKPTGEVVASTQTDKTGAFAFHHVGQGRWRVRAHTTTRSGNVSIEMTTGDTVVVVLQLVEVNPAVTVLQLTPSMAQHLRVGNQLQVAANGYDDLGAAVPAIAVSWAVQGHIGTMTPTGLFQATRAGSGLIVAQYGDASAAVQVIVSPSPGPGPGPN